MPERNDPWVGDHGSTVHMSHHCSNPLDPRQHCRAHPEPIMGMLDLILIMTTLSGAILQSNAVDLTKIGQSIPKEDIYYIFDVIGNLSSDDITNGFKDLNPVFMFKVLGGRRFIILVKVVDENSAKYFDLDLPKASTITAYVVERDGQFAKYLGVNGTLDQELIPFPDKNLNLIEFTLLDQGVDLDTLKKQMKADEIELQNLINKDVFHFRDFHITGHFPLKFISFINMPPYTMDRDSLEWAKKFGDLSQVTLKATPMINI